MGTAVDYKSRYSYADYITWTDEERWELIDGHPYNMSPAPSRRHQEILLLLARRFSDYLDGKHCSVFIAPFDVRFSEDYSDGHLIDSVVQPDLSVFCDSSKLDGKGAKGAPDLVVEVLSPPTAAKDMKTKLLLYQKYQVKEYWLVDPEKKTIEVFQPDDSGKYNPGMEYDMQAKLQSVIFEGLEVDLNDLFSEH